LPEVTCLLCGRGAYQLLCDDCLHALTPNTRSCVTCALPLTSQPLPGGLCGACFARPPPFTRTVAPLLYRDPLTYLVHRAKSVGGIVEAEALGRLLADAVGTAYVSIAPPVAIVPVPLAWRRLVARGHNQSTLIARASARRMRLPILHSLCRRVRHTPPQAGLSRSARLRNLARAFEVRSPAPRSVAVVDDVMTTGTTVRALARVLRAHGAEEVHVWVVARTAGKPA
jgi:ComF family protein